MDAKTVKLHTFLLVSIILVFVWSRVHCLDKFTWFLEALPVLMGVPILIYTYHTFRMTNLVYILICIHVVILLIGAHYTYAQMPLFNWIRDSLSLSRNHYDRLGHFSQGFVPAMIAREVFWRKSPLKNSKWLPFMIICFCLAFSALFELFEWLVAVVSADGATAYLATQGDVWDTQWDMLWALIGSIASLLILTRIHDRALNSLTTDYDSGLTT